MSKPNPPPVAGSPETFPGKPIYMKRHMDACLWAFQLGLTVFLLETLRKSDLRGINGIGPHGPILRLIMLDASLSGLVTAMAGVFMAGHSRADDDVRAMSVPLIKRVKLDVVMTALLAASVLNLLNALIFGARAFAPTVGLYVQLALAAVWIALRLLLLAGLGAPRKDIANG